MPRVLKGRHPQTCVPAPFTRICGTPEPVTGHYVTCQTSWPGTFLFSPHLNHTHSIVTTTTSQRRRALFCTEIRHPHRLTPSDQVTFDLISSLHILVALTCARVSYNFTNAPPEHSFPTSATKASHHPLFACRATTKRSPPPKLRKNRPFDSLPFRDSRYPLRVKD